MNSLRSDEWFIITGQNIPVTLELYRLVSIGSPIGLQVVNNNSNKKIRITIYHSAHFGNGSLPSLFKFFESYRCGRCKITKKSQQYLINTSKS